MAHFANYGGHGKIPACPLNESVSFSRVGAQYDSQQLQKWARLRSSVLYGQTPGERCFRIAQ